MEEKISDAICSKWIEKKVIPFEYKDVYVYGFEMLISTLVNIAVILLLGMFLNQLDMTIIFLFLFIFLRRLTGGYHANTRLQCRIYTLSAYLIVIAASNTTTVGIFENICLGGASILTIARFCPIENPNKPITEKNRRKLKYYSIIIIILFVASAVILLENNIKISMTIFYTISIDFLLMIKCII